MANKFMAYILCMLWVWMTVKRLKDMSLSFGSQVHSCITFYCSTLICAIGLPTTLIYQHFTLFEIQIRVGTSGIENNWIFLWLLHGWINIYMYICISMYLHMDVDMYASVWRCVCMCIFYYLIFNFLKICNMVMTRGDSHG